MSFSQLKRLLLGEPLASYHLTQQKIPKWKALSTLSSDALSSVAYASDAMLIVLAAVSTSAVFWSIPIAFAIATLLIILTASYRQTIDAYPGGGGAYTVAKENLGSAAGLIAGAALLIDYALTVSVSVSAGVENIASAFPELDAHRVAICVLVILVIMLLNLRGVRESATVFAFPTYFFISSIFLLLGMGFWRAYTGQITAAPLFHADYPQVGWVLLFRAFGFGCSALTGVEAISNSVAVFQEPAQRNAKKTMVWMSVILGSMFLGITALAHLFQLVPNEKSTLISLLGRNVFGDSVLYYFIQFSTASILFLAANTSYTGFPRLASVLARDRYMPRQLASLGDRLVFSNGIIGLSLTAAFLIILFQGHTVHLLPLYALGVFLSFTLSQAGMVVYHLREKKPGWVSSLALNGLGALATLVVLLDIGYTKFLQGAWIVLIMIPIFLFIFLQIHKHYISVALELSQLDREKKVKFKKIKHVVIVPVSGIHQGVLDALEYASSISDDVRACYVDLESEATERMEQSWLQWAPQIPFVVLKSPYRSILQPLLNYLDDVEQASPVDMITVVIPEFVTKRWWHQLLHNHTAIFIRAALAFRPRKIVTSVRYHLKGF